jgi:hypothetical protein
MLAHTAFLRASSEATNLNLDVTVVANGLPPDVPFGVELAALAQAMSTRWTESPTVERNALVAAAGEAAAERAIGVAATFQMMNRLLDGVGAPVRKSLHPLAAELGFEPADIPR